MLCHYCACFYPFLVTFSAAKIHSSVQKMWQSDTFTEKRFPITFSQMCIYKRHNLMYSATLTSYRILILIILIIAWGSASSGFPEYTLIHLIELKDTSRRKATDLRIHKMNLLWGSPMLQIFGAGVCSRFLSQYPPISVFEQGSIITDNFIGQIGLPINHLINNCKLSFLVVHC